jgi:hypothetical protein
MKIFLTFLSVSRGKRSKAKQSVRKTTHKPNIKVFSNERRGGGGGRRRKSRAMGPETQTRKAMMKEDETERRRLFVSSLLACETILINT